MWNLSKKESKFRKLSNKYLNKKIANYFTIIIQKKKNMMKKVNRSIYLNIIKIVLNKIQIILVRFCMKIASDTTL